MADRVVILDVKRANQEINPREIKQMFGRAGRVHGSTDYGHVHLVMPRSIVKEWQEKLTNDESFEVRSTLHETRSLCFHVVAQIVRENVKDKKTFEEWYSRTLDYFQRINRNETPPSFEYIMSELEKTGTISYNKENGEVKALPLGKICAAYYFSPYDVRDWFFNIVSLCENELVENDICQAWCIANIDSNYGWENKEIKEFVEPYLDTLKGFNLDVKQGVGGSLIAIKHILNGTKPRVFIPEYIGLKSDINRIINAFGAIIKCSNKVIGNRRKLSEILEMRFKYGIPTKLVDLVKIDGIGKTIAKELFEEYEITSKEELIDKKDMIYNEGSSSLKAALTKVLKNEKTN